MRSPRRAGTPIAVVHGLILAAARSGSNGRAGGGVAGGGGRAERVGRLRADADAQRRARRGRLPQDNRVAHAHIPEVRKRLHSMLSIRLALYCPTQVLHMLIQQSRQPLANNMAHLSLLEGEIDCIRSTTHNCIMGTGEVLHLPAGAQLV